MNIAICDDIAEEAGEIRDYLRAYFEQNGFAGVVYMYDSGEALLKDFSPGRFDVLFLDIYMGGITGVETAARIRESDPSCLIVFITSSGGHMREGFALRAASYVEKPLTPEKLEVAFTQCRNMFMKSARYIEVEANRQKVKIPFARLSYVEGMKRSVFFHMHSGETIEAAMNMKDAAKEVCGSPFLRCHRSYIVALSAISSLSSKELTLINGRKVPVSRSYYSALKTALEQW